MTAWALRATTSAGVTTPSRELPDEPLEPLRAVVHIDGPRIDRREHLVTDSRYGFGHRQDSGCVPRLLFLGSVGADPLGDELLLLLVQGCLRDLILPDLLLIGAPVCAESTVRLRRYIFGEALIDRHVEQHASAIGDHVAGFRSRGRV